MGRSGGKVKYPYSQRGSAVKSMVSHLCGPSPPIAVAISRRMASAMAMLLSGEYGGTTMWISMNCARPTLAT